MARKIKPLIYVFWEGESEQAYTKYLKSVFEDVAIIRFPSNSGLFLEAGNMFNITKGNYAKIRREQMLGFLLGVEIPTLACKFKEIILV